MFYVQTTTGVTVFGKSDKGGATLAREQAEADAADRNRRAEEMGLQTRYEAAEV